MDRGTVTFVALEVQASWSGVLADLQPHVRTQDAVVEAQQAAEAPAAFALRVIHRLRALQRQGTAPQLAVIASNGDSSSEVRGARYRIARELLTSMVALGQGELVLLADRECPEPVRHELFALAGALCDELGSTEVGVRVRFRELGSGLRKAVKAPADESAEEGWPPAASGSA